MPIKIAVCADEQYFIFLVEHGIKTHPQSALFEVTGFATAKALLEQPIVYDLLIADATETLGEIDGFALAAQVHEHTKIVFLCSVRITYLVYRMNDYYFELFDRIHKQKPEQILRVLDHYLAWQKHPKRYPSFIFKRTPPQESVTLTTKQKTEITLRYDDILYVARVLFPGLDQVKIITIDGQHDIIGNAKARFQIYRHPKFYQTNNGLNLINLNHCALNLKTNSLLSSVNGGPITLFELSKEESRSLCHYFFDLYF